jgi:hypothetical protein
MAEIMVEVTLHFAASDVKIHLPAQSVFSFAFRSF